MPELEENIKQIWDNFELAEDLPCFDYRLFRIVTKWTNLTRREIIKWKLYNGIRRMLMIMRAISESERQYTKKERL